ncbi:hypothetical protein L2755_18200 [Shewanella abyssi]|uniref:hypothetical protein n=1 Tax=Shewanella abyssi TaxID=311789 RepID=UPI002010333D|nr:hypothetical protein [Shewanella abyssi]MCL1051546.1 hypothetical protein [Shewanella abyssi]
MARSHDYYGARVAIKPTYIGGRQDIWCLCLFEFSALSSPTDPIAVSAWLFLSLFHQWSPLLSH